MSDASEMLSGSEAEAVIVPKKEKRLKKEKKRKAEDVAPGEQEDAEVEQDDSKPSKKRKREIIPSEIEIDVSLPEPASKKAARKAKKAKTAPAPTISTSATTTGNAAETETAETKEAKRSDHSVWIGNLPWSATKETLRTFLTTNAEITDEDITRIHMPAPRAPPRPNWTDAKPTNKGFAYVDFATELAMYSCIALTETRMDNRPLLIKNSKNFEGRPDKPKEEQHDRDTTLRGGKEAKAPSKKIFVGNLGFETSKEDLETHFAQCGVVENIHMATFEDTGKCKGFAWVTFEELDAATAAVKGYVYKIDPDTKKSQSKDEQNGEADDKSKKRKFRLNKLLGRDLRCEFAEDGTTRYQKRYGKKPEDGAGAGEGRGSGRPQRGGRPFNPRNNFQERKVDPRTIAPGSAHMNAPRASAAIVKSEGKKTTFD
jgi:RNA recognition motif-containing protein